MFTQGELLRLVDEHFPSALVCFMPDQTNLHVYVSLLSDILQPVAYVLEWAAFGDVVDDDGSIHFSVVAEWR